jgi:predicted AAA+ superfamily ATPase
MVATILRLSLQWSPMPSPVQRALTDVLRHHVAEYRQMAFVLGPRQVGKTTVCRGFADDVLYLKG